MRKRNRFIAIIFILLLLLGCSKGGNDLTIKASPTDKTIIDLMQRKYNDSELEQILSIDGTIDTLNQKYPIECIRICEAGYRVSYLGEKNVVVIMFDNKFNRLYGNKYKIQNSKDAFEELKVGQLLDNVMAIDPDGNYLFLYTGRNDVPKTSYHYTTDGYLIIIEYDDLNIITKIEQEYI